MTPGSFDPTTCRAIVGDECARALEAALARMPTAPTLASLGLRIGHQQQGRGRTGIRCAAKAKYAPTGTPSTRALSAAAERRIPSTRAARMAAPTRHEGAKGIP